ncbi:MAG: hydantoinase/oxoprolinase family protein, partial [Rhodospirillales bacterium]|nr:hydantoinase/oxoprolinase family protein [Rhodospirillales bacterium]
MNLRIAIDTGGTFTDVVARAPDGWISSTKLLSHNPEQYEDAAIAGMGRMLGLDPDAPLSKAPIQAVKMGTTVATNALLERQGEDVLLVTNRGFADALRIGYQERPRLFDLNIQLPPPIHARTLEVDARIGAEGAEITPLDTSMALAGLEAAYEDGFRAVAILLIHGYRYPDQERSLADLAREVGFSQISVSHEVSPLIKMVGRGDTTVVDAYLSPILRRYVDQVAGELGREAPLMFMQSNGGLTHADLFRGKDSILSGPAGGVVGATETAARAGFDKVITFDMGGTSTDVAHYAGRLERAYDTRIAGLRLRTPVMRIHTVAAGGGSILQNEGGRYRVGPASAGADPGPACYGKGGPATVTDANLVLGRLQPAHFPNLFGPGADQPLDLAAARAALAELASDEDLGQAAEGFLAIAIENMANAIKRISVEQGHDVSRYALVCFGGAGGQHACRVANILGMETILIHPLAGVLSALGMGLARLRVVLDAAIEAPLVPGLEKDLCDGFHTLEVQARAQLEAQGVDPATALIERQAHLRYAGTDTPLEANFTSLGNLRAGFEAVHRARFGFHHADRELIVEQITLEAMGAGEDPLTGELATAEETTSPPEPVDSVEARIDGKEQKTKIYRRSGLAPGQSLDGPAMILEDGATSLIEPGWRAKMDALGNLVLRRAQARPQRMAPGTQADPVRLELFNNLFMSTAEQMGAQLANTASSVNIKERLDFSCALFDAKGGLVANAPHLPAHLGSMGESVTTVIRARGDTIRPGQVFALNAPYAGGTHLPDLTVIAPHFDEDGEILFYMGTRGHHADIGGTTPGSMPPDSRNIAEEGVLVEDFTLVQDGQLQEEEMRTLLASGPYPARNPDQNIADLKAQIAACETGQAELKRMIEMFGLPMVRAYMGHVRDNAAEAVRRVLDRLPDGSFEFE